MYKNETQLSVNSKQCSLNSDQLSLFVAVSSSEILEEFCIENEPASLYCFLILDSVRIDKNHSK
jgi:hypothetical protein